MLDKVCPQHCVYFGFGLIGITKSKIDFHYVTPFFIVCGEVTTNYMA